MTLKPGNAGNGEQAQPLVLVADDDDLVRQALGLFLQEDGYRVVEAADGKQAVAVFFRDTPDIVLMDANMPHMDGFVACREIKQSAAGAEVPVLIVTVMEDEHSIDRGFEAGADDYIPKPFNWALLSRRVRNLIERKRAESERVRLEAKLRQAQKMEAIGRLAGGIAHDFNNILASIIGHAELAQSICHHRRDEELGEFLRDITESGRRGQQLIGQILTFSHGGEPQRQSVDAQRLMQRVEADARLLLPEGIRLHHWYEQSGLSLMADPVQLQRVFINLVVNARDAMEGEGDVQLSLLARRGLDVVCAACQAPVRGDFVELSVADTGRGISPERLARIFEPFYTNKDIGKGTGLGLAVVHGIVHDHGGHILVDSAPGQGSRFRILLPMATGELPAVAEAETRPESPVEIGREFNGRVLVVDDEPAVGRFLQRLLMSMGFEVVLENGPEQALERFRQAPDAFDLVFTDQTMPGMEGAELARHMLALRPALPIILCTGFSATLSHEKARQMGIGGLLSKPFEITRLQAMIRRLLSTPGQQAS